MKTLFCFLCFVALSFTTTAQCITNQEAINTPTTCKRGAGKITDGQKENAVAIKDADKWASTIYTIALDAAIKKTTGLVATWNTRIAERSVAELATYTISLYMKELGCDKDKKLYTGDGGIDIEVTVNSLKDIVQPWKHTETKMKNNEAEEVAVAETIAGQPIYIVNQQSVTEKYSKFAFYKKTKFEKTIVVTKPGVPLFLPVSIKDVLLINKANYTALQKNDRKGFDERINQSFESYLAKVGFNELAKILSPADLAKEKEKYKKSYEDDKKEAQKYKDKDIFQSYISIIDDYLKKTTAAQLAKPCIGLNSVGENPLKDNMFLDDPADGVQYVIINPVYYKGKAAAAPQFIAIKIALPEIISSTTYLTARKVFEDNVDFKKLEAILQ